MEQNGTCSDRSWDSPIVIKAIPKDWDVFDYPSMDKFPEVGLEKTAYIDLEANSIYRWDKETEEYVAIGGGGGTADYERLRNLPKVEGVVLTGDRSASDLGLAKEADLNSVEVLVPEQASEENKLADQNFVNSSIATNTAYYIYKTVDDKKVPFDSLEELEAYTGTLTNNDYAFVVGTDESGNTTYTRYKYSEAAEEWAEEYVLNNSSFTAAQWASITSGITSGKIAEIDAALATIPQLLSGTGQSETAGMTQKAITDALANAGEAKELTASDYNWPTDNPTGVAAWLLAPGMYVSDNNVYVWVSSGVRVSSGGMFIVGKKTLPNNYVPLYFAEAGLSDNLFNTMLVNSATGSSWKWNIGLSKSDVVDRLNEATANVPLSAKQGKVLNEYIGDLSTLTTTDKTSAVAAINEVAANAGGVKVLTTDDYNYPENNPTGVALWLLNSGMYVAESTNVSVLAQRNTYVPNGGISLVNKWTDSSDIERATVAVLADDNTFMYHGVSVSSGTGSGYRLYTGVWNGLTSTSTTDALSAYQGKVLKGLIDALEERVRALEGNA